MTAGERIKDLCLCVLEPEKNQRLSSVPAADKENKVILHNESLGCLWHNVTENLQEENKGWAGSLTSAQRAELRCVWLVSVIRRPKLKQAAHRASVKLQLTRLAKPILFQKEINVAFSIQHQPTTQMNTTTVFSNVHVALHYKSP